jgi:hypothetical protein
MSWVQRIRAWARALKREVRERHMGSRLVL